MLKRERKIEKTKENENDGRKISAVIEVIEVR